MTASSGTPGEARGASQADFPMPLTAVSQPNADSSYETSQLAFSDSNVDMKSIEQPATIKEEAGEYDETMGPNETDRRPRFVDIIKPEDDEELKERLGQFEHLKENLYLTDRYCLLIITSSLFNLFAFINLFCEYI